MRFLPVFLNKKSKVANYLVINIQDLHNWASRIWITSNFLPQTSETINFFMRINLKGVKIKKTRGNVGFLVDLAGLVEPTTSSSSSSGREEDMHVHSRCSLKLERHYSNHAVSSLNFFIKLKDGITRKSWGLISYLLVDHSLRYSPPKFVQNLISRGAKTKDFLLSSRSRGFQGLTSSSWNLFHILSSS